MECIVVRWKQTTCPHVGTPFYYYQDLSLVDTLLPLLKTTRLCIYPSCNKKLGELTQNSKSFVLKSFFATKSQNLCLQIDLVKTAK